jgi:hypothetical protein
LTASGAAYCWGLFGADTTAPTPLAGDLILGELSGLCGVTTSGAAYCWSDVGNAPTPVPGSLTFATVSVGGAQICGVTTSEAAYCWGSNGSGQLAVSLNRFGTRTPGFKSRRPDLKPRSFTN